MTQTFKFSVWDGYSNNVFYRELPSYEVASNIINNYPPGYIATAEPVEFNGIVHEVYKGKPIYHNSFSGLFYTGSGFSSYTLSSCRESLSKLGEYTITSKEICVELVEKSLPAL